MANNNMSPENQAEIEESLSFLENLQTIPAYKALESGIEAERSIKQIVQEKYKDLASFEGELLNQTLFDIGANTYNAAAVPMNIVGGFLGYNPGFSGERFMENLPWEKGISSLAKKPEARFDPDYPWGVFAPEGGERQYTYLPQEQTEIVEPPLAVASEKEVITEEDTAISYAFGNIDPRIKSVFDNILSSDQTVIDAYFNKMELAQKNAFLEYSKSPEIVKQYNLKEE
tara:strand:+ start:177 stop:863 length:687 start_codon:yes stop_codon:yes gene_type:complete